MALTTSNICPNHFATNVWQMQCQLESPIKDALTILNPPQTQPSFNEPIQKKWGQKKLDERTALIRGSSGISGQIIDLVGITCSLIFIYTLSRMSGRIAPRPFIHNQLSSLYHRISLISNSPMGFTQIQPIAMAILTQAFDLWTQAGSLYENSQAPNFDSAQAQSNTNQIYELLNQMAVLLDQTEAILGGTPPFQVLDQTQIASVSQAILDSGGWQ